MNVKPALPQRVVMPVVFVIAISILTWLLWPETRQYNPSQPAVLPSSNLFEPIIPIPDAIPNLDHEDIIENEIDGIENVI